MKAYFFSIVFFFNFHTQFAQKIEILQKDLSNSFRGLSVVNDSILWVSGNNGIIGISNNAGKTFEWKKIIGYEKTDFRDIEAFDAQSAIVMAVGEPAILLKTIDAGQNWTKVYENNTKGMFLDAMDFLDNQNGVVIGDPIDGRVFLAKTKDGGTTWKEIKKRKLPKLLDGENFFAASGGNIKMLSKHKNVFVSGGIQSHLYRNKKFNPIPFINGRVTCGANAIAMKDHKNWMIVGGDYTNKDAFEPNVFFTDDAGTSFEKPIVLPRGYRSGVEYLNENSWIICGLSGVDISDDNGKTWINISSESFHVVKKNKKGNLIFLAGNNQIGIYKIGK